MNALRLLAGSSIVVLLGACSSGSTTEEPVSTSTTTSPTTEPAPSTSTEPSPVATEPPESAAPATDAPTTSTVPVDRLSSIAAVICDDAPVRMGGEAELFTDESWQCTRAGEGVRIDLYVDVDQRVEGGRVMLDFYAQANDPRTLAELPIVCGPDWTAGFDFNETRDTVRAELSAAGLEVVDC